MIPIKFRVNNRFQDYTATGQLNAILAVLNSFLDFIIHFADEQKGFLGLWSCQWKGDLFFIHIHSV